MKTFVLKSATAAVALFALSGVAAAQTMATATTDLNIRSGPGPEYEVVGVIDASDEATIDGCIEGSKWCQVTYNGVQGWAYSDYLTASLSGGETVVLTERPPEAVPTVTYETTASTEGAGAVTGATTGAVAGAIIAGPVGAAVGGAAGAVAGGAVDTITPPQQVVTYVQEHQVEPVYLEGEVVVGAQLPETVTVREIPDYEYRYVYVNGQPVLVEPQSRRIVYVMR
ncbi:DUF1236 domain-containing protein [Chelativorans sp. AA-79]|uniref:DUF1236 domain-containing protein n=1 Tax=Chelativorans sp. AA-79 TaxID=3028735 RepID=UPI0023F9E032|nr:DUF1236 domain-containing protein [Chelativorans sp. AA-79]WEX09715.1 DUF1236 domain-containing protein [Chelativorans sp. AA-79]